VVGGGDDVELELAVGAGEEDARVDLDLFDGGAEQRFEGADGARLLAGAGGAVDEQMWEVAGLRLERVRERKWAGVAFAIALPAHLIVRRGRCGM
jgi:hypothetical protein